MDRLGTLRDFYRIEDEVAVEHFLGSHLPISDLLNKAIPHLVDIFGEKRDWRLSLFDYTDGDTDTTLFATVYLDLSPEEAIDRLDVFLDRWYLDKVIEAEGKLIFSVSTAEGV